MFFIFSGLPGCGKSTIAKRLAERLKAVYLRVDTVEQAIRAASEHPKEMGPEGYFILYELARDNLRLGNTVITDSVNDHNLVRDIFRDIAISLDVPFLEVEILCSDRVQHRARVEKRVSDIPGLKVPDWNAVMNRHYEPWNRAHLRLDTAEFTPTQCVDKILEARIPSSAAKKMSL